VVGTPKRVHRLADEIFAQNRSKRSASVAAPGERRLPRAFQLDVAPHAVAIQDLAEQDCAPIAELTNEVGKLVSGIGHGNRLGAKGGHVAGENRRQFVRA